MKPSIKDKQDGDEATHKLLKILVDFMDYEVQWCSIYHPTHRELHALLRLTQNDHSYVSIRKPLDAMVTKYYPQ